MKNYNNIYDISILLGEESITFPGDTPYRRKLMHSISKDGTYESSQLIMSAHTGTHIDVPAHFIPDGKNISQYSVGEFILPAQVINIRDKESIKPNELEKIDIKKGGALLFKTDNSISGRCRSGIFSEKFVYLSSEAADILIKKQVRLTGIDYISIEKFDNESFPVHKKLLGNNILILESINLEKISEGEYTLFCLPLKIKNCEASPVRAVLVD